ncbi:BMP and activin membrane-bound inhibitor-like [Homarus americanus]|uniref:BMP and activin membrane-bound inhibitor-like n=1 Tax=Homarus americanus TaxID=6706 RepID=A0A8J5JNC0_HOMAM|nr:BMP and activin membrane-bound inhibitor-like [Homarus americanus]
MFLASNLHFHLSDMKRRDSEMMETLWFRAATIAVPIAGGFILIVLVLLASRMLAKENKRQRMAQVIGERYLKAPLYPGGTSEPIPHHPIYYHTPITKNSSLAHLNFRASYEEKPSNYRPPETHICNLEEIKPLNTVVNQDEQWDQRDTESPLPS